MERVRLEPCEAVDALVRGLAKISRDLVEAAERTPDTVSSRQIVEEAERLSHGLLVVAMDLKRMLKC